MTKHVNPAVTKTDFSVEEYIKELMAVTTRFTEKGISQEHIAQATMSYAHAVWDDCYGPEANDLLDAIKANHPTWENLTEDKMGGYSFN
jgi:hypothetical protein